MSYARFGLMILTSTVGMYILMYLNTYAAAHLSFSETRLFMALCMGAAMAVIMLAFMLGMYADRRRNVTIFVGAGLVFVVSLWLLRSQATVSGPAYMRAMIPHHSIAILTSERAQIRDPRTRKLADEIIEAQRREIGEMAYLVAELDAGRVVEGVYEDPPPAVGTIEDALASVRLSTVDPAPMPAAEADRVLGPGPRCTFRLGAAGEPILWASDDLRAGAVHLNNVLLALTGPGAPGGLGTNGDVGADGDVGTNGALGTDGALGIHGGVGAHGPSAGAALRFVTPGVTMTVRPLGADATWRGNAELVFTLDQGLTVGYRGFWACAS